MVCNYGIKKCKSMRKMVETLNPNDSENIFRHAIVQVHDVFQAYEKSSYPFHLLLLKNSH